MPESDPDNGEINDVDEFLREVDQIDYDETLVDLVGQGYDVNAPGDQAVADLLGAWRDDVARVPVDSSRLPSAHTARGELPPTAGGTLSIAEHAARLYIIGNDEAPATGAHVAGDNLTGIAIPDLEQTVLAALQQGSQSLDSHIGTALACVGEGEDHQQIGGAGEHAKQAYATAIAAAAAAAEAAKDVAAKVQGAQQAAAAAEEATRAFLGVVKEIAQKHGG